MAWTDKSGLADSYTDLPKNLPPTYLTSALYFSDFCVMPDAKSQLRETLVMTYFGRRTDALRVWANKAVATKREGVS